MSSRAVTPVGPSRRPPGRPRDLAKVDAILDAGWASFLAHGVEAVSMEAIAVRAGVSKGTLYSSFADKAALFEAVMSREMERIEAAQGLERGRTSEAPLSDTLRTFGLGIMAFLASEPAIGFYGALSAELRRRPDLARAFWDLGPGQTRANLAAILEAAAHRGEIEIEEPVQAAEALFGLWQGFSNLQLALDVGPDEARASIAGRVERGIAIFMRAHRRSAG
ncbi:MAG: TetR/AcrR family transcriptional regulator [Gemmatimonadaceae bacterium]|nr:TetR/AcrR family transcriptional regulator [Acetobacteraceae bacterium]